MGPQGPSTRGPPPAARRARRPARGPPMDYADKLPPSPWYIFAPPPRYIFPPPLTRPAGAGDDLSRGDPASRRSRHLCQSVAADLRHRRPAVRRSGGHAAGIRGGRRPFHSPTRGPPPAARRARRPARGPPMDYADKLPPSPWYIFAPPPRYIFPPPLTRPAGAGDDLSRGDPASRRSRHLCQSVAADLRHRRPAVRRSGGHAGH